MGVLLGRLQPGSQKLVGALVITALLQASAFVIAKHFNCSRIFAAEAKTGVT